MCNNCGKKWDKENVVYAFDLQQRVDPGGIMPSGECPDCGALCYPENQGNKFLLQRDLKNISRSNKKIYITMDGGLIQCISVTRALKDVDFIIIDFDTEGTDEEDITICNGEEAYVRKGKADEIVKRGQFKFRQLEERNK